MMFRLDKQMIRSKAAKASRGLCVSADAHAWRHPQIPLPGSWYETDMAACLCVGPGGVEVVRALIRSMVDCKAVGLTMNQISGVPSRAWPTFRRRMLTSALNSECPPARGLPFFLLVLLPRTVQNYR